MRGDKIPEDRDAGLARLEEWAKSQRGRLAEEARRRWRAYEQCLPQPVGLAEASAHFAAQPFVHAALNVWLVVPTACERDSLWPLLDECGVPHERCVVVVTKHAVRNPVVTDAPARGDTYANCPIIQDTDDPNMQRWWNKGIEYAIQNGGDAVIVVNDDVVCNDPLTKLTDALQVTGATLAQPGGHGRMTGWCYALRLQHNVRPDEHFEWWFGDKDLWMRAGRARGIVDVPMSVEHIDRRYGELSDWQAEKVWRDRDKFAARHNVPAWQV